MSYWYWQNMINTVYGKQQQQQQQQQQPLKSGFVI